MDAADLTQSTRQPTRCMWSANTTSGRATSSRRVTSCATGTTRSSVRTVRKSDRTHGPARCRRRALHAAARPQSRPQCAGGTRRSTATHVRSTCGRFRPRRSSGRIRRRCRRVAAFAPCVRVFWCYIPVCTCYHYSASASTHITQGHRDTGTLLVQATHHFGRDVWRESMLCSFIRMTCMPNMVTMTSSPSRATLKINPAARQAFVGRSDGFFKLNRSLMK
jgi:hypothetical protein